MRVLVACEFSGIVRDTFLTKGHDAWSCDLLESEKEGPHIKGNVLDHLDDGWDLMIGHPPCTYLANSGIRWLYKNGNKINGRDEDRWNEMNKSVEFFLNLLNAPIEKIAIENPIQHIYARNLIKIDARQSIQPWQFGHEETKETWLWEKNLPLLKSTKIMARRKARVHFASPGVDRWKERSRTLNGIAQAMAEQWG